MAQLRQMSEFPVKAQWTNASNYFKSNSPTGVADPMVKAPRRTLICSSFPAQNRIHIDYFVY